MKAEWIGSSLAWVQQRCWAGCALAVALALACTLHAQPLPTASKHAGPAALAAAGAADRIGRAVLTQPQYSGLSGVEKATVTFFAVHGLLMVESGRCVKAYSEEAAVETFFLTFLNLSHNGLKAIITLPTARKTELVDTAMELASKEVGKGDWCGGHLLPENSVKPLSERRAGARNLLLWAILAVNSDPSAPRG